MPSPTSWRRFKPDNFLLAIVAAAIVASIIPATGAAVAVLGWTVKVLIAVLFFLYGARLSPQQSLEGLRHWRLHGTILSFTYLVFPALGLLMHLLVPHVLTEQLYLGMLYVTLVPSTVQSSINFTSIAKGNVAGAIVSASFSNLLGVFLTPLLVLSLMTTAGGLAVEPGAILDIVVQLLIPFLLGQLSRRWTSDFVARHRKLKLVDQGSIVLVVYSAFSTGMREHMWTRVGVGDIIALVVVCVALLTFVLWLTWRVSGWLGFNRADRIAIQMCGTKKSLATGVPMATVLFAGMPIVGLIVLPLMVFHQAQLMACGTLASHYARQAEADAPA